MKKVIGFAMIALASLSLAACGSQSNGKSAKKSGDVASKSEQPTATNKKIAKELEAKFNTDGEKNVETKIQTDVADDTDKTGHQVIQVILTNQDSLKNMKAAKDALDSNTANDTQKLLKAYRSTSKKRPRNSPMTRIKSNSGGHLVPLIS